METTTKTIQKLQIAFNEAWGRILSGNLPASEAAAQGLSREWLWTLYMERLDCLLIDKEDLLENFPEMVNFGFSVKDRVCLEDPCNEGGFILVDKGLAEKTLVLGALP